MAKLEEIKALLGAEADSLLNYECAAIPKKLLVLPGPDFLDGVVSRSDRNAQVLRNLKSIYSHGRLANTGYLSILPVDQDLEHDVSTFTKNPIYLDPENIIKLAMAGGCNAVVSSAEALAKCSRDYA
ncbi:MAG: fructose-bisphosphate aldolase, partial [Candidatus Pacearchaeota archaeon]|nr:fructose-bisphosphate aldolase [Candidatus Pacearchaeota archaeon]